MKIITYILILTTFFSCKNNEKNGRQIDTVSAVELSILFSDSAFSIIEEKRLEAIAKNHLHTSSKDYVPAELLYGKKRIAVKARLKGDHIDHLEGNRWSFRIKTLKGEKVFGETKFSIQGLETRAYLSEVIFHKLLENEGVAHLQYFFLPFSINNIDSLGGYYAFESHFKSEVLKIQNLKSGPILKFDESQFWDYKVYSGNPKRDSLLMAESKIEVMNKQGFSKKVKKKAIHQLDQYRKGILPAEEVFDLDKWARVIAVSRYMEGKHNLRWHNLRFYYNPSTNLIEPIGFDSGTWRLEKSAWGLSSESLEPFYIGMYKSENFSKLVEDHIVRLCQPEYMDAFLAQYGESLKSAAQIVNEERGKGSYSEKNYYSAQERVLSTYKAN